MSMPGSTIAIRRHLARVESDLRARDTSHLSEAQRTRRRWALNELRTYRRHRPLPRNTYDIPSTPIFLDAAGRRCAVAHLIAASGEIETVARVHDRWNLARIPQIHDPGVAAWADRHGLTLEELTEIQPSYDWTPVPSPVSDPAGWAWTSSIVSFSAASVVGVFAAVMLRVRRKRRRDG